MGAKVDDKVIDIGQKHGLKVAQMEQLSLETNAVMLGYTHPDKFEESLKGSLELPDEQIKESANDVNNIILKDIRDKFMSLYESASSSSSNTLVYQQPKEVIEVTPQESPTLSSSTEIELMPEELNAGIKENTPAPVQNNTPVPTPTILKKIEAAPVENIQKTKINSILNQKLSSIPFQIPNTKTEYSLNNLSKTEQVQSSTSSKAKNSDPYREIPE